MSSKPRTIDNIGIDISIQYAQNMENLDTRLLEESRVLPYQTEVMVTSPYIPSEWDTLFNTRQKHIPWAQFFAPPSYASHRRNLFSYQLIPSMGTSEKQEAEIEKLQKFQFKEKGKGKGKKREKNEKEEEQEEKERDILVHLLKSISFLDKQIVFVNSRRGQYQRG